MDSICNNQQTQNSGLLRFRSAPSSLFSELNGSVISNETMLSNFKQLDEVKPVDYWSYGQAGNMDLGLPACYPTHNSSERHSSLAMERSNGLIGSIGLSQNQQQVKRFVDLNSNLYRQNSSPPGFFGHVSVQQGSSELGVLPQISEADNEGIETNQSVELENRVNILSHHLSLPKTKGKKSAIDELLDKYQDFVPCKIRAKRGCATHPRSIAERERRTRISERMKKLQELVPSMDKQTSTAEMLDLAIEYIKDLQTQHKILSDQRAKCKCSIK